MESMSTTTHTGNESMDPALPDLKPINFKYGLPGFESLTRFVINDIDDFPPFQMLSSLDEENFSLLVLSLSILKIENGLSLLVDTLVKSGITREKYDILLVLKLDRERKIFTANLKAPVCIRKQDLQGSQIILDEPGLPVDFILNKV